MGAPKKWLKIIVGTKRSSQVKSVGKDGGKASKWNLLKCVVIDKGATLTDDANDDEGPIHQAAGKAIDNAAREEHAAIRIQTAFRAFLARRALRALKGLARLQAIISGQGARKQSLGSLRCIQDYVRVQARIRAQRMLKSKDGKIIPHKFVSQATDSEVTEGEAGWVDTLGTVEEIQARELQRQEAAIKRERAMAYAFSNQWRANTKLHFESLFDYELNNSTWSWIWLDRWISGQSADNHISKLKEGRPSVAKEKTPKKTINLKKSASLSIKKASTPRVLSDASNEKVMPLPRARSHGTAGSLQTEGFSYTNSKSAKKQATRTSGELFAGRQRSLSNPKQQPSKGEMKGNSLPNKIS